MKLIDTTKKLVDLRYQMSHVHMTKLQAIIIPSSDAHQVSFCFLIIYQIKMYFISYFFVNFLLKFIYFYQFDAF